jgi:hypothetical protein
MPDGKAFKAFICDIAGCIVNGTVGGASQHRTLEDIFYTELRCNLIHEAELKEVGFSESKLVDGRLEGTLSVPTTGPAEIPDFWVLHLIVAIKAAPENAAEWPD